MKDISGYIHEQVYMIYAIHIYVHTHIRKAFSQSVAAIASALHVLAVWVYLHPIADVQHDKWGTGCSTCRFCCPRCKKAVRDAKFLHLG